MTFRVHPRLALALALSIPVTAVVATVWAIVWATHYQPIVLGQEGNGWRPLSAAVDVEPTDPFSAPTVYLRDRPGRRFLFGFSVRNAGGTGVALLGIDESRNGGGLAIVRTAIGPHHLAEGTGGPMGGTVGQAVTLDASHSAALPPGDDRVIWFTLRQDAHCVGGQGAHFHSPTGAALTSSSVWLRYRVGWFFTRTAEVPMPYNLTLSCKGNVT